MFTAAGNTLTPSLAVEGVSVYSGALNILDPGSNHGSPLDEVCWPGLHEVSPGHHKLTELSFE